MNKFNAMHGLAIKKFASAASVADLLAGNDIDVAAGLEAAVAEGQAVSAKGAFMLSPKGHTALAEAYPEAFKALRTDKTLLDGYAQFEFLNGEVKQLITEWQTIEIAGEPVPNDHSDSEHDKKTIDRIAALHDRADPLIRNMAVSLPRLVRYADRLSEALDRVDDGQIEFVSGVKVSSYHTVWFELHEDLLRLLNRKREE
jgi:hypothetical protein